MLLNYKHPSLCRYKIQGILSKRKEEENKRDFSLHATNPVLIDESMLRLQSYFMLYVILIKWNILTSQHL